MSSHHQHNNPKAKPINKGLHPRNSHNHGYDFDILIKSNPTLAAFVKNNDYGNLSINFADPKAVKALNTALLKQYYNIVDWDIPEGALCPPIPGRVDYIHYVAELLGIAAPNTIHADATIKKQTTLLDIGTGANGIYPLLACQLYGWHCVGSDINSQSLENVASIIAKNPPLKALIDLRLQHDKNRIFDGIIQTGEFYDVSVCNPPFHASEEDAIKASKRKLNNLARNRGEKSNLSSDSNKPFSKKDLTLNFGGIEAELWYKGGEIMFLKKLIKESQIFSTQCHWFTSLVSKSENISPAKKLMSKLGAKEVREIEMKQGNKITRILAWTFL